MNAVDLGLSVLWADCNIEAKNPQESGNHYACGEILPKNIYDWDTYKWYNEYYNILTKYCTSNNYSKIDNKIQFELKNDVAYIKCGNIWRIPTFKEWIELSENCIWTWIDSYNNTDIAGQIGISKINSNYIFLPATGFHCGNSLSNVNSYGAYWSSLLDTNNSSRAWYIYIFSDYINRNNHIRNYGFPIRPVLINN